LPALGQLVGGGQEDAVELVITVQTPRDLVHTNGLHPPIDRAADMQLLLDLIIGEQGGGLTR
jgi:hypothetical protein